jgi:hypothetical protein
VLLAVLYLLLPTPLLPGVYGVRGVYVYGVLFLMDVPLRRGADAISCGVPNGVVEDMMMRWDGDVEGR